MSASGPPYVCIEKDMETQSAWCERQIDYSKETYYQLKWVLENRRAWTCPACLSRIRSQAQAPSYKPFPAWGWFELVGPFIGIGGFITTVVLEREYGFDFQQVWPIMVSGLAVMIASTITLIRKSRRADEIGEEHFQEKLKESPNYGHD